MHPILDVGSLPFRVHLAPGKLEGFPREFRGPSTVAIQSSLRYDNPPEVVKDAVNTLTLNFQTARPLLWVLMRRRRPSPY
ncbi:MAG: phosphoenolpyruvate carboxylase [Candidatus Bathyarchaeia archaeon]